MERTPIEIDFDFFATAAQVIPVLFILIAVEFRHTFKGYQDELNGAEKTKTTWLLLVWVLAGAGFLVLAEGLALYALADDRTGDNWERAVGVPLTLGGFMAIFLIFLKELDALLSLSFVKILLLMAALACAAAGLAFAVSYALA
jgi:hypothetical protein